MKTIKALYWQCAGLSLLATNAFAQGRSLVGAAGNATSEALGIAHALAPMGFIIGALMHFLPSKKAQHWGHLLLGSAVVGSFILYGYPSILALARNLFG